jgi:hypothetical protein
MGQTNDQDPLQDFPGFYPPRYTPIPDQLLDGVMAFLSGAELKVLLYIMRHTYGYKKSADSISVKQMVEGITAGDGTVVDHGTGLSKASVHSAVKRLEEKALILVERRDTAAGDSAVNVYRVREAQEPGGLKIRPPRSKNETTVGQKVDPQETTSQETIVQDENETSSSSFFQEVGERWGRTERDARSLGKSMAKWPRQAVEWAEELLNARLLEIDNPAAWLNAVVPRLTEEMAERQRDQLTRKQEDLAVICATADFYSKNEDPAKVRVHLLQDFEDPELVDQALNHVFGKAQVEILTS